MAATPLSRFELQNGVPLSVTLDAAYQVAATEFFLLYTVSTIQYGDIFTVNNPTDKDALIIASRAASGSSSGSGTGMNAVLTAGGPNSSFQPQVSSVTPTIS